MKKEKESKPVVLKAIEPREITQELRESYLDYAMSVIVSRALPDVRDGLKPVQRRILWAMWDGGITSAAKLRKAAYVVGECFVKDTLISTTRGLLPIQDVAIGDQVYTQSGSRAVQQRYRMPAKPLITLTLRNGVSTTVTPSQKFKVIQPDWSYQWKEAKDLTENDYLISRAVYPEIIRAVTIGIFKNKKIYLNEGIAYMLGLFVSDGWISRDYSAKKDPRIGFVASDRAVLERIQKTLQVEFNYEATITVKKYHITKENKKIDKELFILRINNRDINYFLSFHFNLGGKKALTKEIPAQIFQSPRNIIFTFISGLIEGDGSISQTRNRIQYTSISEKLINQFTIVLASLGIASWRCDNQALGKKHKKHFVMGKEISNRYSSYNLEISGANAIALAVKINLEDAIKSKKLQRLQSLPITSNNQRGENYYDVIPYASKNIFSELSAAHQGGGWYRGADGNNFRMGIVYPTGAKIRYATDLLERPLRQLQIINWGIKEKLERIQSPYSAFINDSIKNNIRFIKVASIQNHAPEETYDLEVEGDHEFIANGVLAHNCMGKYHPHGDMAIYDTMVRMAQDFSLRYPLIQGQGNFGSIDGDGAAAPRYTEARMSKIAEELLFDVEKETVDWQDNYDSSRQEPKYLPAKLPNLLLNGAVGIAVGMATNIPPHNLNEVVDAILHLIENPTAAASDLMQFIQGPDFPTGGIVYDKKAIAQAYVTGRGSMTTRAVAEIEDDPSHADSSRILISEIPYQVNKSELIIKMAELVTEKRIEGIRDIRDESDKDGLSIVIELKKDAAPQKVLNQLYQHTDLQKDFHMNLLALAGGLQPEVMSVKDVLGHYLDHRKNIVRRRAEFDLKKAKERAHILEGLSKALDMIDEIIKAIRKSADRDEAFVQLVKKFHFSDLQATAILEMRLQTLAALERQKIDDELAEKKKIIAELEMLLKSVAKILGVIKTELKELKEKFGDARRTKVIAHGLKDFNEEDLIAAEEVIITLSRGGYIKRALPSSIKSQHRGGKGLIGAEVAEEDFLDYFVSANTHDNILFFTDRGRVFQTKVYEIPAASRTSKGKAIHNFLEIPTEEKVNAIVAYGKADKGFLVMATRNGFIKKTALEEFGNVRRNGIIALSLKKDDQLRWVRLSSGSDEIILTTVQGQAIRFKESQVRQMGRTAAGVIAIREKKGDSVASLDIIRKDLKNARLLVIMERGYGKQTQLTQYKVQSRGGSGIKTAQITAKTGALVGAHIVDEEAELFVVSVKGQIIHTEIKDVRVAGRATQGVKIMNLNSGDKIAGFICL